MLISRYRSRRSGAQTPSLPKFFCVNIGVNGETISCTLVLLVRKSKKHLTIIFLPLGWLSFTTGKSIFSCGVRNICKTQLPPITIDLLSQLVVFKYGDTDFNVR